MGSGGKHSRVKKLEDMLEDVSDLTKADLFHAQNFDRGYLSLAKAVTCAFAVEHKTKSKTDIGKVVGWHKSTVTKLFSQKHVAPSSIRRLLEHLRHPVLRALVVRAWADSYVFDNYECIPPIAEQCDYVQEYVALFALMHFGALEPALRQLRRIDTYEQRLGKSYEKTDIEFSIFRKSGIPAGALLAAARIVVQGRSIGLPGREALGHFYRAWILSEMPRWQPELALEALEEAYRLAPQEVDTEQTPLQQVSKQQVKLAADAISVRKAVNKPSRSEADDLEDQYDEFLKLASLSATAEERAEYMSLACEALERLDDPFGVLDHLKRTLRNSLDSPQKAHQLILMAKVNLEKGDSLAAHALFASAIKASMEKDSDVMVQLMNDMAITQDRLLRPVWNSPNLE